MSHHDEDWKGFYFETASVLKLRDLLNLAGPTPKLEVRLEKHDHPIHHMDEALEAYFKVVPSDGYPLDDDSGVNDSHTHPPYP